MYKLAITVGNDRLSANDVWNIIAAEGNVHTKIEGDTFVVTSDWNIHLVRIYNQLQDHEEVPYLHSPTWMRA